jgi:hypothetical protein
MGIIGRKLTFPEVLVNKYKFSPSKEKEKNSIKKWQVTYIAPLNHLPLLSSDPGGVQQELVV